VSRFKLEDLNGNYFGNLYVVRRVENYDGSTDERTQFLCKCLCGEFLKVVARNLKRGKKSCKKCLVKKKGGGNFSIYKNEALLIKGEE
tara:strand:- start:1379 stop:1642 length:264 start_codon:yes stop_codon:yes gene_type:complete